VLILIPFVMIRGAHLPTLVAGLVFIPLQVLIAVVSPLAGMLCRRFGRRLPLFARGASSPWDAPSRPVSVRTRRLGGHRLPSGCCRLA
jgi:MFS family permease